jgi:hypothetical protein
VALIELSLEAPAPPAAATPPPAYVYRRAGLVLAVLLLFVLGGAVPPTSLLWQRVGRVPLPEGGDFEFAGGQLYTVDLDAQPRELAAWQTDPPRRLWSYPDPGDAEPFFVTTATPDVALLRAGRRTVVLDAHTGAVRWTSSSLVQQLTDRIGLVQQERFRPGTEYDPESGEPGRLYGSTGDALHTEPAQSTELRGVELATGRPLWSVSVPGSVYVAATGSPATALVVLSADQLTVRSPFTGSAWRERTVPRVGGANAAGGEVVGDTVLVHYGAFGEGGRVTAYALDSLDERWQQNRPDPAGGSADCAGLPCMRTRDDLTVLDPRTGASRWRVSDTSLMAFGAASALAVRGQASPVRTVDVVTGRPEVELSGWAAYFRVEGREAYVLSRPDADRGTVFGLLRPGRTAVQPLGRVPDATAHCQPVPGLIACRVSDGIEVWSYHG